MKIKEVNAIKVNLSFSEWIRLSAGRCISLFMPWALLASPLGLRSPDVMKDEIHH
jgi:hypothetical protein